MSHFTKLLILVGVIIFVMIGMVVVVALTDGPGTVAGAKERVLGEIDTKHQELKRLMEAQVRLGEQRLAQQDAESARFWEWWHNHEKAQKAYGEALAEQMKQAPLGTLEVVPVELGK